MIPKVSTTNPRGGVGFPIFYDGGTKRCLSKNMKPDSYESGFLIQGNRVSAMGPASRWLFFHLLGLCHALKILVEELNVLAVFCNDVGTFACAVTFIGED